MAIAVRELKAGLSHFLAQAQAGEVIEVTSHNKPIARIIGIPAQGDSGLRQLVASGAVAWAGGKPPLVPPLVLSGSGTTISQMVLEDRR